MVAVVTAAIIFGLCCLNQRNVIVILCILKIWHILDRKFLLKQLENKYINLKYSKSLTVMVLKNVSSWGSGICVWVKKLLLNNPLFYKMKRNLYFCASGGEWISIYHITLCFIIY